MNLAEAIADNPGAVPLSGPGHIWHWAGPTNRLQYAATTSQDENHILQTHTRDSYDEHVVRDVLVHAREHATGLAENEPLIRVLPGFTTSGRSFDTVVLVSPTAHSAYTEDRPELHLYTFLAFPAYDSEYSGTETVEEAELRTMNPDGILLANLNRESKTYVKMRSTNLAAKRGTRGDTRWFDTVRNLSGELEQLENSPGGFIEFENYLGQVWRVEWDGQWVVTGENNLRIATISDALDFSYAALGGRPIP